MLKIRNCTQRVVAVYNEIFSVNLDINETVDISDDIIAKNPEFNIKYLSLKNSKKETVFDLKRGGIRRRLYLDIEFKTNFPIITVANFKGVNNVKLKADDIELGAILIFWPVILKRISCEYEPLDERKAQYMFLNEEDKVKFLKRMAVISAITFPIGVLALLTAIYACFYGEEGVVFNIVVSLFFLGMGIIGIGDLYYRTKAKKWKIRDEK